MREVWVLMLDLQGVKVPLYHGDVIIGSVDFIGEQNGKALFDIEVGRGWGVEVAPGEHSCPIPAGAQAPEYAYADVLNPAEDKPIKVHWRLADD